jgi:tRNA-binding EMAP/Myf-like protein
MKIPLSWLKDFIDLDGLSVEDIARKLTLAGMEVDEILYAGLPMPVYKEGNKHEFKTNGIAWGREKIVVAEIREVKPHPNADRLTLLDLYDGEKEQGARPQARDQGSGAPAASERRKRRGHRPRAPGVSGPIVAPGRYPGRHG